MENSSAKPHCLDKDLQALARFYLTFDRAFQRAVAELRSVEELAEQEALGFADGAHVEVESFEELVEFIDFMGVDGELRGVDSVLAEVEEKFWHGTYMMGVAVKV